MMCKSKIIIEAEVIEHEKYDSNANDIRNLMGRIHGADGDIRLSTG